ncbi:MAG: response regulator [SAR324 cluster bacterium]|nr:response regulator [SAR324 cluster bacterium]
MPPNKFFLLLILLFCLSPFPSQARPGKIKFERISTEHGLSNSIVYGIIQDQEGFMWFSTQNGINRYDGYTFKVFRVDPFDPAGPSSSNSGFIHESPNGILSFSTWLGGLNQYDPQTGKFTAYPHDPNNPNSISDNSLYPIFEDASENLWIGTYRGGMNQFDPKNKQFIRYQHDPNNPNSISPGFVYSIEGDKADNLWIGTDKGLDYFDRQNNTFQHHHHTPSNNQSLSNSFIRFIYRDSQNTIWVGTRHGLNRFNEGSQTFTRYLHNPDDPDSISNNIINWIYEDRDGRFWVGTKGGLNLMDREKGLFTYYQHDSKDPDSLSSNDAKVIYQDRSGTIWVGTQGGGLNKFTPGTEKFQAIRSTSDDPEKLDNTQIRSVYIDRAGIVWVGTRDGGLYRHDRTVKTWKQYLHDPNDPNSISNDRVYSTYETKDGEFWVGTEIGLNHFDRETEKFTRYLPDLNNPYSILGYEIRDIHEDANGILWISTFHGLNRFVPGTKKFQHFQHDPDDPNTLDSNKINHIYEDVAGQLWLGSWTGMNRFDPKTGKVKRYTWKAPNPKASRAFYVNGLYESSPGILWIGSAIGLAKLNAQTGKYTFFTKEDGLPHNNTVELAPDQQGNLWISTQKGISKFNLATQTFRNYDIEDGLHGRQFSSFAFHKTSGGEIFFGGIGGITHFFPENVKNNPNIPPIVITSFKVFDKPVQLEQSITKTKKIKLSHQDNFFTIEFTALDFRSSRKNQYAYQLVGVDKDWTYSGDRRSANYTNLSHGHYTFRVKGSNNDGVWNEEGATLEIIIIPPFWQTWWAYAFYIIVVIGFFAGSIRIRTQAQAKELEKQRVINERLTQVNQLKDEFLSNTTHELRTPLAGIIGMGESMLEDVEKQLTPVQTQNLFLIVQSAKRLSNLINDILDFSKIKHGSLQLKLQPIDLKSLVTMVMALTQPLVGQKQVKLENQMPDGLPLILADEDRLQQILYNLLQNAIKFTNEGSITVEAQVEDAHIRISISDTGIGISERKIEHIFEYFEQLEGTEIPKYGGTGLGLPITKLLVELHKGSIEVQSPVAAGNHPSGSTFTVRFPISQETQQAAVTVPINSVDGLLDLSLMKQVLSRPFPGDAPIILAVDDEAINLRVLQSQLQNADYRVLTAQDGEQALAVLEFERPDLMILDLMMPGMSGYDVCRQVRKNMDIYDLPILILTARHHMEDKVKALDCGANDYVTKPFDKSELLARIQNLLRIKENKSLQKEIVRRQNTEKKLIFSHHRLVQLLDVAEDAIIAVDEEWHITFFNQEAERLLGYSPQEILDRSLELILPKIVIAQYDQSPIDGEKSSNELERLESQKELLIYTKHQKEIAVQTSISRFQINGETAFGLILRQLPSPDGMSDTAPSPPITSQQTVLEELNQSRARLQVLEEVLNSIMHQGSLALMNELRTLDSGLENISQFLSNGEPRNELRQAIVNVMQLSLEYWELTTYKTKINLAEESKIWKVYLNQDTYQTRTLDKYLNLEKLPKNPRWRDVLKTASYVLSHCPVAEPHKTILEKALSRLQNMVQPKDND